MTHAWADLHADEADLQAGENDHLGARAHDVLAGLGCQQQTSKLRQMVNISNTDVLRYFLRMIFKIK